jgi:hypothetical protein
MKSTELSIALIVMFLIFAGCEKENTSLNIINFSNSECKNKSAKIIEAESITFKSLNEYQLKVFHNNTYFNCCPGELFAGCEFSGDTVNIIESEKESTCDCICPYDLEYTIDHLIAKTYNIKLNDEFLLKINFNEEIDTTIILNN